MTHKPPRLFELVALRKRELGIDDAQIAARAKVSRSMVYQLTKGRTLLGAWRVRTFARVLRVPVNALLASIERSHAESGVLR